MKKFLLIVSLVGLYSVGPVEADVDNPELCIKTWQEGKKFYFKNSCDHYVYVMWCDEYRKNSKKTCGWKGKYYNYAFSMAPGKQLDKYDHPNLKYGVCAGMRGMQQEWKDYPNGEYSCGKVRRLYGS